jgi:acyl-CoA synthetase (AMP-forming)/AMP-acid ligase II
MDPENATYNLADIWELTVDHYFDREAIICGDRRVTYAELEDGANRFANYLLSVGVGPGQHVGLYLQNCPEFVMAMIGSWKVRAVPINVNYRYVAEELRYLFNDADLVALVADSAFVGNVDAVKDQVPSLHYVVYVGDGAPAAMSWEVVVGQASADRPVVTRSGDDLYIMYTGGTTGMPKGVVWRHEDAFFACIGGGDPMRMSGPVASPAEMVDRILPGPFTTFPCAPLIHAAAQWTSLSWWYCGGRIVLQPGSFDGRAVWQAVEDESVGVLIIVGDAMARPLMDAWEQHGPFDISSLFTLSSGGAPLSPAIKERIQRLLPNLMLTDGYGSSETGAQGVQRLQAGEKFEGLNRFAPDPTSTLVMAEDLTVVEPGSDVIGRVARSGYIPIAYYGDEAKTSATFVVVDGTRWVLTGDAAMVDTDGSIRLLGRGSGCINSGGEKVFPEEVEAATKSHPAVYDCVVAGAPDERWGETVVALVSLTEGTELSIEELQDHCRSSIAGYKLPRRLVIVDEVRRSPVGKADYRWAKETAATA